MFEKPWQDGFSELTDALDVERVVGTGPGDDVVDGGVLNKGMCTSSMSISFSMKRGVWVALDFLERARLI